jgi:hypothetical protein
MPSLGVMASLLQYFFPNTQKAPPWSAEPLKMQAARTCVLVFNCGLFIFGALDECSIAFRRVMQACADRETTSSYSYQRYNNLIHFLQPGSLLYKTQIYTK